MVVPGEITVRGGTLQDVDTLAAFQLDMAKETEDKSLDVEALKRGVAAVFESSERGFYLVAEARGRVVGDLLVTYEWSDWNNANRWWIQSVFVDRQWRRKGVYRALYGRVQEMARSTGGVCAIRLYVERDNLAGQRTYETLGMAQAPYYIYEVDCP